MKPEKDLNNLMKLLFLSIPTASGAYLAVANEIIWPTIKLPINAYYNVSEQPQSIENCAINNSDDNTNDLIAINVDSEPTNSLESDEIDINIQRDYPQLTLETCSYLNQLDFDPIIECSDSSYEEKTRNCSDISASGQYRINDRRAATKKKLDKLVKQRINLSKNSSLELLYASNDSLSSHRTKSLSGTSLEITYFSDSEGLEDETNNHYI